MKNEGLSGTFSLNRYEPIHRWYSYIEGYSSCLVEKELDLLAAQSIRSIYDPFGGTGTTLLSASMRGIIPYYSETNPFMAKVTYTKINSVREVLMNPTSLKYLQDFRSIIEQHSYKTPNISIKWNGFEKFYESTFLNEMLDIKQLISTIDSQESREILMLALSSIAVTGSKMIRRGDLRYAKPNEKKGIINIKQLFLEKLDNIISDILLVGKQIQEPVTFLAADSRKIEAEDLVDCVITSPPYLNGTNYIRNTKLELKLNDYVETEKDLANFHSHGIVAGINNVSKRNTTPIILPEVENYWSNLKPVSYDTRIPVMVANYFYDMDHVFSKLKRIMKNGAPFIMDIGDSQFAGIHIPTHEILKNLCINHGFLLYDDEVLRTRYSKNGMKLSQRLMKFTLHK